MTTRELYERETGKNALRQIGKRLPENTWQFSAWLESRAVLAEERREELETAIEKWRQYLGVAAVRHDARAAVQDCYDGIRAILDKFPNPKGI